ncbi:hypothetical protein ACE01N_20035, partial [Saccharicrinis sp. FJH2]|uniref:hypothetical protein n=1 Tax=Saccharicrinis sp. FJH65 TaxID=3344659 RepID=UPI0035F27CC1
AGVFNLWSINLKSTRERTKEGTIYNTQSYCMAVLLNKIFQHSQSGYFVLTVPFPSERNCHDSILRERCMEFN